MSRKYYTLVVHEDGWWNVEFGSYSRAEIRENLDDYWYDLPKSQYRILATSDDQAAINAALRKLEGGRWS